MAGLALAGVGLVLGGLGLGWSRVGWASFQGSVNGLKVDWREPQAWLATPSLSAFSRDVVKAPVLRELLTEDLVFYYEEHEDRLALLGALKRLAFEHQVTLPDQLLQLALDGPAEVAWWPDAHGAARHWALAMGRGPVARALQSLAPLAAKDLQLTRLGEISLALPGQEAAQAPRAPVLALALSPRRTLALVSQGERLVVMSDPGLLFSDAPEAADGSPQRRVDPQAQAVLAQLLAPNATAQAVWQQALGVPAGPGRQGALASGPVPHQVVLGGALATLQYQHFFPSWQALGLTLSPGGQQLHTRLRLRAEPANSPAPPWAALPAGPAACAAVPVDWARVRALAQVPTPAQQNAPAGAAVASVLASLDGPAAVCWYGTSQLHTPLLVARAKGRAPDAATLEAFMRWWLPAGTEPDASEPEQVLSAPFASRRDAEAPYRVALRRVGDWWLFSPDAALVQRAANTVARLYPSVADGLNDPASPAGRRTVAVTSPTELAGLIQAEALAVLGPRQALFRQAAQTRLFPQLARFGQLPAAQAVLRGQPDAQGWTELAWLPLPPLSAATPVGGAGVANGRQP